MNKVLAFILFLSSVLTSFSQEIVKSQGQLLVEQAIDKGLCIVRQSYQLEDTITRKRFGRYGKDEFGAYSSLAIRTSDGYIVDSQLLSPWETDSNFSRYRTSHKPVIAQAYSKELGDSIMSPITFSTDSLNFGQLRLTKLCPQDSSFVGFDNKRYISPTEGWVVWLSNDSTISESIGLKKPDFTIFKRTVEFNPDTVSYKIDTPNISKQLWGGIFVVPEQTEIGQITFFLGGVIVREIESNEWILVTPVGQTTTVLARPEEELTPLRQQPVDKKKKNKKKKK